MIGGIRVGQLEMKHSSRHDSKKSHCGIQVHKMWGFQFNGTAISGGISFHWGFNWDARSPLSNVYSHRHTMRTIETGFSTLPGPNHYRVPSTPSQRIKTKLLSLICQDPFNRSFCLLVSAVLKCLPISSLSPVGATIISGRELGDHIT